MLAREMVERILARAAQAPCIGAMRFELLEFDEGYCRLRAPHDPAFDGLLGGFHGGMMAMTADCVAWCAIVTQTGPDERLVTTDMQVRYLSPCMTDLIAAGRVIKLGRFLCPVQVEMSDETGKLTALATVTYMRLPPSEPGRA